MAGGLTVRGVSFNYGEKRALDDVSFHVPPGRFTALLGPNGAGKSTLIALLTRLLATGEGDIEIGGHNLRETPLAALGALGVVFQQPTVDLDLTVRQNLSYFAALQGIPRATMGSEIDAALERLSMAERQHEKARHLNGGHRRRMELARAMLHKPQVLLLDEPTVGLDAASRASITEQVHVLADEGMSVLWATHLADEVRDDDHVLLLHKGRISADGQVSACRGDMALADWFLQETGAGHDA